MSDFSGKNVLITGGTTGIGRATAELFIEQGANVAITGRNPETLEVARQELKGKALIVASDAADPASVLALIETLKKEWDRIDVLFLNAGVAYFAPIEQLELAQLEKMIDINVKGPWLAVKAALPLLGQGSRVIVNSSVVSLKGLPGSSGYAPTKAATRSLVRVLAAELAPKGILVNSVSPGPIQTPIYGKMGFDEKSLSGFAEQIESTVPLRRFGEASDIGQAVLYLAGAGGKYVTGIDLPIDGGLAQV